MTSNGDKFSNENRLCEISGSHIGVAKGASLLGFDAVSLGEWFMFREFAVPSSGVRSPKRIPDPETNHCNPSKLGELFTQRDGVTSHIPPRILPTVCLSLDT
jgi:hypothetical protein